MYEIVQASEEHLKVIQHLAHEIWPKAYGEILSGAQLKYMLEEIYAHSSLQNQIGNLKHSFILIKNEKKFVGFASFSPHVEESNVFRLNKLYVLPEEQGKHGGKLMLDYITEQVKKGGARSIQLNVNRFNKAFYFYKKQGFTILREEDIDIGEGYWMNDWILEKKI